METAVRITNLSSRFINPKEASPCGLASRRRGRRPPIKTPCWSTRATGGMEKKGSPEINATPARDQTAQPPCRDRSHGRGAHGSRAWPSRGKPPRSCWLGGSFRQSSLELERRFEMETSCDLCRLELYLSSVLVTTMRYRANTRGYILYLKTHNIRTPGEG
jgi:hypothetical protein